VNPDGRLIPAIRVRGLIAICGQDRPDVMGYAKRSTHPTFLQGVLSVVMGYAKRSTHPTILQGVLSDVTGYAKRSTHPTFLQGGLAVGWVERFA
jgi:hypothetical protein